MSSASQSHSSRRGGRCSSRSDFLTTRTAPFRRVYNKWIVLPRAGWNVVQIEQCHHPCPLGRTSGPSFQSFRRGPNELCEQVAALRNVVQSQHAGNYELAVHLLCFTSFFFAILSPSRGCFEDLHGKSRHISARPKQV